MGKKLLFILSIVLVGLNVQAQIDFDKDTAIVVMEDGIRKKANIQLTNNSGHPINLRWRMLSATWNDNDDGDGDNSNNWDLQFCDCVTCYSNFTSAIPSGAACVDPMGTHPDSSKSVGWYINVNPNGQPMIDAEWVIEVTNTTDNLIDTLVYLVVRPNSVKEVSYNADVTSYPNPANTEFVVNYTLTNVSAPTLNVYSIVGGKIGTYTLNQVNGSLNINTSELENGMYFYTIEEQGQRVFIQKFNVVH